MSKSKTQYKHMRHLINLPIKPINLACSQNHYIPLHEYLTPGLYFLQNQALVSHRVFFPFTIIPLGTYRA